MSSFTPNIGLIEPTPADPAVANLWGGLWNTNAGLIDTAIAGLLSKSVAGSSNIALTVANGASAEARYAMFNFTGILTGNIDVLWPDGVTGLFAVTNSTSGAFTLSLGVNNGSGSPAGGVVALPQGATGMFRSDGTNVVSAVSLSSLAGTVPVAQGGTGATTAAGAQSNLGVPSDTGAGASGTWNININGNAATATSATSASTASTATTAGTANALNTGNAYTMAGLTVNGAITASGNITAAFSDDRLKIRGGRIERATAKLATLDVFYYRPNDLALKLGAESGDDVGLSAQQVQSILPEVVAPSPLDKDYLTIRYERLVPLLVAAIKELTAEVEALKRKDAA